MINNIPRYSKIPHISGSNILDPDDIISNETTKEKYHIYEKIDGANCRMGFDETAILGNRDHILNKGYIKKETPAKLQFRSAWNFIYENKENFIRINDIFNDVVIVYGEWMYARHSFEYNLPTYFIPFDGYLTNFKRFVNKNELDIIKEKLNSPDLYIGDYTINDAIVLSNTKPSLFREKMEGIIIRDTNDYNIKYKYVNPFFSRRQDFQDILIKNKKISI